MKITIRVEQRHIDEGKPGEACLCPVALALNEISNTEVRVIVENAYFGPDHIPAKLPKSASQFICKFDNSQLVEPFKFRFKIPSHFLTPTQIERL